jgi:hypothetical protein
MTIQVLMRRLLLVTACLFVAAACTSAAGGGSTAGVGKPDAVTGDTGACTPDCGGKFCGDDGCGGACGACTNGAICVTGICAPGCTDKNTVCDGATLHECTKYHLMEDHACTAESCQADGFKDLADPPCGPNGAGQTTCLCLGCTSADTKCNGKVAQVCDENTQKLSSQTCTGVEVCKAGACIAATCTKSCANNACGMNDGCGGVCSCTGGLTCLSGSCTLPATVCGNGQCEAGETASNCQQDCMPPVTCGDGSCNGTETTVSCPGDCKCTVKDSFCDPDGQSLHYCDATQGTLTQLGCQKVCGDAGKGFTKCQLDPKDGAQKCFCKLCGNGTCEYGESYANCPADCACTAVDNTCATTTSAQICDTTTGKLAAGTCSDANCKTAQLGKSLGCTTGADGIGCYCQKPGCGDGFCEGNESKSSCPVDCVGCATNADCTATEVCSKSIAQCVPADGATYFVKFKSGTAPATAPGGGDWDTWDLSPPDPYVYVYLNGTLFCWTDPAADTFAPAWNATCTSAKAMNAGDVLTFTMFDDDVGTDDKIDTVAWQPGLMALLHTGSYNGAMNGAATLSFSLQAQ